MMRINSQRIGSVGPSAVRQVDDAQSRANPRVRSPHLFERVCFVLAVAAAMASASGCSLFVMAGKMIYGDPKFPSKFHQQTGVDLAEDGKTLLVVCTTPESIKSQMPSLDFDLVDRIMRRLKLNGIDVIEPDEVAKWIDDNGGVIDEPTDLIDDFDADYIVHINLTRFTFKEDNSPSMYRGRTGGSVDVFQVRESRGEKRADQVFVADFQTEYPRLNPVSTVQISKRVFQQQFLDHISNELSRFFHDFRRGDDF